MLFDFVQAHHALGHSPQTQLGQARSKIAVFLLGPRASLVFPPGATLVGFVDIPGSLSPGLAVTDLILVVPPDVFLAGSHRLKVLLLPPTGGVGGAVPRIVLVLSLLV